MHCFTHLSTPTCPRAAKCRTGVTGLPPSMAVRGCPQGKHTTHWCLQPLHATSCIERRMPPEPAQSLQQAPARHPFIARCAAWLRLPVARPDRPQLVRCRCSALQKCRPGRWTAPRPLRRLPRRRCLPERWRRHPLSRTQSWVGCCCACITPHMCAQVV
jgi:hypothetical protein